MAERMVTVKEAAELLGVCEESVRDMVRKGRLGAVRNTPRKTRIFLRSVVAMITMNNHGLTQE